eukprot:Tbor_TRINITY_DN5268_c0_g1::TRINITY_DN5268_c0_g1_i3::g.16438::m.16438
MMARLTFFIYVTTAGKLQNLLGYLIVLGCADMRRNKTSTTVDIHIMLYHVTMISNIWDSLLIINHVKAYNYYNSSFVFLSLVTEGDFGVHISPGIGEANE